LVDIHDLDELKRCELTADGSLLIGSGVCYTAAIESDIIKKHLPHLRIAAQSVGGLQVRNVATIGGNICNGVTSADSAAPLFASNAKLVIQGPGGRRESTMADFYLGPGQVALEQNEILVAFLVSRDNYDGYTGDYYKYAMRNAMDIATIGCAATCRIEGNILEDLRLAFGVAAPTPIRCPKTEAIARGESLTDALLQKISKTVEEDVNPRTSWRASREFRIHIIKELSQQVVRSVIEKAGGNIQ
jgi:xanthine dehydrogenase FAD-binding subunit